VSHDLNLDAQRCMNLARRFNAGITPTKLACRVATVESQASLRDAGNKTLLPGVETPGKIQTSLRDETQLEEILIVAEFDPSTRQASRI
jgi:hypothetical protein